MNPFLQHGIESNSRCPISLQENIKSATKESPRKYQISIYPFNVTFRSQMHRERRQGLSLSTSISTLISTEAQIVTVTF